MEILAKLALDDAHAEREGDDDEHDRETIERGVTREPALASTDSSGEERGGREEDDGDGTKDGCTSGRQYTSSRKDANSY